VLGLFRCWLVPRTFQAEQLQASPVIAFTLAEKLGIPIEEQKASAGVAVDAVLDSVPLVTAFREKLAEAANPFCSMSEAVREQPELGRKYIGSVVPHTDNFFAALNAAVYSEGTFVYVPKGVRCPMELNSLAISRVRSLRLLIVA